MWLKSGSRIFKPIHLSILKIWLEKVGESILEVDVVLENIFFFSWKDGKRVETMKANLGERLLKTKKENPSQTMGR